MTERDDSNSMTEVVGVLTEALERDLLTRYGPILGGEALRHALGYASTDAFRQALSRRQLPVPIFELPNRRGKFALAKDVAHWLASARANASFPAAASSERA